MVVGWMVLSQQTQSGHDLAPVEIALAVISKAPAIDQGIPEEYLNAHQASAPSASSYYIQNASYKE